MRAGIIGAGIIWRRNHEERLRKLSDRLSTVAFSARTEETRKDVSEKYPHASVYADYKEMLSLPDIDVAIVLTPIKMNAQVTLDALDAGKHALVEKPFCVSSEDGRRIMEKSEETGKRVFVLEQFAYDSDFHKAREIMRSGSLGEFVHATCVSHSPLGPEFDDGSGYGTSRWRMNGEFPLGMLFDGGIHYLAAFNLLFGSPKLVSALGQKCRPEFGEYDHIVLQLEYKDGASLVFSHSSFLSPKKRTFDIALTGGRIEIGGGVTARDRKDNEVENYRASQPASDRMWEAAIRYLENGEGCEYQLEAALDDIKLLESVKTALDAD